MMGFEWSRTSRGNGYEVSTKGDKRFSALVARLRDGRTIEEAYQLDVKGYRAYGNDWRIGKGKKPITAQPINLYAEYLTLWKQWALENPKLIEELRMLARGKRLTDCFAKSGVSQARALAHILNETETEDGQEN